ncbi:MAG: SLBB domain-containing protein, partial [Acidimicrobiia bacterium]|nr:SLBB domain-containing protein [Acidimicrobiia bacterium]
MAVTDAEPIITRRFGRSDAHTLDGYRATGGYEALQKALDLGPEGVTEQVKAANLQGRGGAGFPAGTKWGFLPKDVFPRYLVVNGDESEPGTYKDRLLMERDPHQLLEGTLICALAVNAAQSFLYVRGEMAFAQERLATALNEAYAAGIIGQQVMGSDWSHDVVLHWGAGAYIVGEETALIESLEGKRGMPRLKPPFFPAARGLYMQPTVVNNVETLSNLPWIIEQGGAAFAALGNENATGMRMFAVSGHLERPGVYEVEQGVTTFRDLFEDPRYGGGIRNGNELKMFIPGGGSAPWFYPEQVDLPLDPKVVGAAGSMLGSGAIVAMDETTCP